MNELLSKVTPSTRGIIWLLQNRPSPDSMTYKAVDYLLNGLLTANLENDAELSSRVLISTNFHFPLHVFISNKFVKSEFESFLQLLKKDMTGESTVLVIDEIDGFAGLQGKTPQELRSSLRLYK